MKKTEHLLEEILDKMFKVAGIDMDFKRIQQYAKKHPHWFSEMTMTQAQADRWREWATKRTAKVLRIPISRATVEVAYVNLMWGLRVKEVDDVDPES